MASTYRSRNDLSPQHWLALEPLLTIEDLGPIDSSMVSIRLAVYDNQTIRLIT